MKILHVNTEDSGGGAAKVARCLVDAQRALGHDTALLVGYRKTKSPDVMAYPLNMAGEVSNQIQQYGLRLLDRLERRLGQQYCLMPPSWAARRNEAIKDFDVIHVHNSHGGYLNLSTVSALSRNKPVVWTLHDEWAYTGHCACTLGCDRWLTGCGNCPDLTLYPAVSIDTTHLLWLRKSRSYERGRFTVTTPSTWLFDRVQRSMLASRPVTKIPNGVNLDIFYPRNRAAAREALGLPRDRKIAMFAANAGGRNPWKGYTYLVEALNKQVMSSLREIFLIGIGDTKGDSDINFDCRWEGRIENEHIMAAYYSAADIFVLPSIAENSPLTVIESMACGTPVVAFDVGGVSELIDHRGNGYIARYRDSDDFAYGIHWILNIDKDAYQRLSENGIEKIHANHALDRVTNAYLELYGCVCGDFSNELRK